MKETDIDFVAESLPKIKSDVNKYDRGRLMIVCGSFGMAGACIMAARAALRSGVGYLDIAVPESIYPIVATSISEAVFTVYGDSEAELEKKLAPRFERADACLIGCGLGENRKKLCPVVFEMCEKPLLIDADGLNFLAEEPGTNISSVDLVLTPHAGEMSRLLKKECGEIELDREKAAGEAALRFGGTALLKGPGTVITDGTESLKNPTGCAGMARAGSGDVLSGIISSLMAQGVSGFKAAATGAYIHGLTGERCAEKLSLRSMLPTDMIDALPEIFRDFQKA